MENHIIIALKSPDIYSVCIFSYIRYKYQAKIKLQSVNWLLVTNQDDKAQLVLGAF